MITAHDIKKLAGLSAIEVTQQEVEELLHHLRSVLAYASRVEQLADIKEDACLPNPHPTMRQDIEQAPDAQIIVEQFPQSAQHFIVVPRIIGQQV